MVTLREARPRATLSRLAPLAPLLLLASCGYGASRTSHQAQISMIGMNANDLQTCAGPADKITKLNSRTLLYTYVNRPAASSGLTVTLPLTLGGVSLGGGGAYCSATMRVVDNRVTEVHYTGDNDRQIGNDGVCEPLIRGCMRQPEATMTEIGAPSYDKASAFHSPSVPQQTPISQVAEPAK